jgi:RimJ/RimL family protein N-acetyltransferase
MGAAADGSKPAVALVAVRDAALRERVLALAPRPEQVGYSGTPAQTLRDAERRGSLPVAIVADGEPVGFFILDRAGVPGATHVPAAVGLRAFFVDARHQGRGIGGAALRAVPAFTLEHFPGSHAVVLTVNVENAVARRVYEHAGFRRTGDLHLGGALGPQHVLILDL